VSPVGCATVTSNHPGLFQRRLGGVVSLAVLIPHSPVLTMNISTQKHNHEY